MKDEEKLLSEAREIFDLAVDVESDNRERAREDILFARMSDQWDEKAKKARDKDGRPMLTMNRLPTFLRQVVNDARQNKPSIKVKPVDDSADPETADIINGIIRNIEYCSDAGSAYDTAIEQAVSGGFGYFRIDLEYPFDDTFDLDIRINRIPNQFSVYADPYSEAVDSSDWDSCFVCNSMPVKQFEKQYPKAEKVDWEHDYKDIKQEWFDGENVTVAEYWKREEVAKTVYQLSDSQVFDEEALFTEKDGFTQAQILQAQGINVVNERQVATHKVTQYIMTAAEILEVNEWPGRYIPIIPVYGDEINIEGERHFKSLIHDAKDAQMMFNYWRTTTTELVSNAPRAPYIGPKGSFDADNGWDTANAENHPYLEYEGAIPPQRQPFAGIPAGALQEALNASDDMKSIMGLYDAALGAQSNETSGRAILARQREGDVSTFHFIDNLSRAIRHAGKILIDLIPKVYSTPRVIRVLGQDETPQNVQVNQPMQDGRIYDLTMGKYDLTVSSGPSFTTQREEAATSMLEFMRVYPNAAPILGDLLAKNMDWPGADEISDRLKAMLPPQVVQGPMQAMQAQVAQQMQAAQQQLAQAQQQIAELQGQLKDKAAEQQIDMQEVQIKAQELQIKQFEAETDRIEMQIKAAEQQNAAYQAQVQAGQPVEVPQIDMTPILAQLEDLRAQIQQPVSNVVPMPKTKTMRAIKQPDGSYLCESEEQTEAGTLLKRARAFKDESGNVVMKTIEEAV